MTKEPKNPWNSNLILSDIPWDYYLHPCPTLYAQELSKKGPTLWVNPPTRNPIKTRLIFKNKNLIILTPIIFKRSSIDSGFSRFEVRLQIKTIVSIFLGLTSSVWSISTPYPHLLTENPNAKSIFWSGDFFSPVEEFSKYKNFDLVLCLTPLKYAMVPNTFKGRKLDFHMCTDSTVKTSRNHPVEIMELVTIRNKARSFTKIAGYVGTLSSRRFDFEIILHAVTALKNVLFVVIGKSDGTKNTDRLINKLLTYKNVLLINGMPYENIHSAIACFDICLIPYVLNPANLGTCPTKFIDYCTSGKIVLSTKLPGLQKFGDLCLFANDKDDFCKIINTFDQSKKSFAKERIELSKNSSPVHFLNKFQNAFDSIHKNCKTRIPFT